MLGQRLRRWANITSTLAQRFVFAGPQVPEPSLCIFLADDALQRAAEQNFIAFVFNISRRPIILKIIKSELAIEM